MTNNIKVIHNRTIIKQITVGTPVATTKKVQISAGLTDIVDVDLGTSGVDPAGSEGQLLIFEAASGNFVSKDLDGGDNFST
jgi:hypothetical protein